MFSNARLVGIVLCMLVLLTTCSALSSERQTRLSGFVAASSGAAAADIVAGQPTMQPSVTPAAATTPVLSVPAGAAAPPLAAVLAPAGPSGGLPQVAGQMNTYLRSLADQGAFSGAVLVAYQGRLLLSEGYGMANQEQSLLASPQSRFRLASVSKPLAALAIMQLQAAGKIELRASICTYLPDCPPAWGPITVHHLLTHQSGLPNYTDFASFANVETAPASPDQVVARFRDLPLGFAPGTLFQYCNSNYVLLGRIVEQVSGQSYPDYMRDQIFAPLGMADTGSDPGDFAPLNGTRGYAGIGVSATPINTSNLFAAGAIYSTVEDLYKLARALDANSLISPAAAAQMYTPNMANYGYGWKIERRFNRRVVYHPGLMSGASTYFGRYVDDGLTLIVLSNNENADTGGMANELAGMLFGDGG